jgi:serine/threonine-protein kinase
MTEPERVCSRCGISYSADVVFCPKDGTPLGARKTEVSDDPYLDLKIAGQFRVKQLIGIGAMGRVYRAHQAGIDRDVAIKVLHRDLLRNPTVIARFHREAKVASRLVHPNVVQVLMTGELEAQGADVGGEAYLVMEFLDGISLRSALAAAGGAMHLPRALHVLLQVADAVGEAHAQGIVHRDLKPENVMLVRRADDADYVKVLDFGVARMDWSDNSIATQAGVIFGTARYISPEGARGNPVHAPGDVYSLATLLFQCLSGETPFDGDSPVAILLKHTSEPPPDVRSRHRASYVPEPIARVITANLAKESSDRCRDAREFGRALLEAARSSGLHPDDLVVRSTLFGAASALQLASMERTKALDLSPETAAKLNTRVVADDAGSEPQKSAPGSDALQPASRDGRTHILEPSARGSAPTQIDSDSRHSAQAPQPVEATLSDEPAPDLRARACDAGGFSAELTAEPRAFRTSVPSRPSSPSGDWAPPKHEPPALWRALLIAGCFVVGVAVTLVVAERLGVFARPDTEVEGYAQRARVALAARAYNAPPGENVRDITDAALRRWPHAAAIVAVRKDAAREVLLEARRTQDEDRSLALRLTELAIELDPHSNAAREQHSALAAPPPTSSAASAAPDAGSTMILKPPIGTPRSKATRPKPKPKTSAPAPAAPPEPAAKEPPASPAAGRWL